MARLQRLEAGADVKTKGAKAVTSTAQLVAEGRRNRVTLIIRNYGSTDLFWGTDSTLSAANGYPLLPDEEQVFDDYVGPVWIVCGTTGDLRYVEVS